MERKCRFCSTMVPLDARTCPKCGRKQKRMHPLIKILTIVLVAFISIPVLMGLVDRLTNGSPPISKLSLPDLKVKTNKVSEIPIPMNEILGFKGLNLGMTGVEVLKLVQTSKDWGFDSSSAAKDKQVIKKGEGSCFISYKGKEGIGAEGPPGYETWYAIQFVSIDFDENKLVYIGIHSQSLGFDKREYLSDWARFALKGLTQKYGSCSRKFISAYEIFLSVEDRSQALAVWDKGDKEIEIRLGVDDFAYDCVISFRDRITSQKYKDRNKSRSKSEL